jgi:hypothetical protein
MAERRKEKRGANKLIESSNIFMHSKRRFSASTLLKMNQLRDA